MATYNPLTSVVLTANTTTVTISNIPQDYTDLRVVMTPASGSGTNGIRMRINGDSGSNYSITYMSGNGSLSRTTRENDAVNMSLNGYFGINTSTSFTQLYQIDLLSYTNTVAFKSALVRIGGGNDATEYNQGTWRSTAAISSLSFNINTFGSSTGDFIAGSRFDLYGIKAGTPKAIGGNVTSTDGTYWYHAFTSSGTFTVQQDSALTAEVLTVAGGGAGFFGGGGAGGVVYTGSQSFLPTNYTVTVGAGGAAPDPISGNIPVSGSNSTVTGGINTSLVAIGGGGGGVYTPLPQGATGANGGSGGGAGVATSGNTAVGGSATSGQGYAGGNNNGSTNSAAGGGGAGAAGSSVANGSSSGANGGAGINTYSSWLSATGLGVSGYIAGGGGGRGFDGRGTGGSGGGGNGDRANVTSGSAGTANTGSGGGGGYSFTPNGWAGGSGLVIVRYPV